MQPFFSIIVVCLNPGDKLIKTLKSIENQSFCDWEVIVKDGMSSDGTLEAANAFAQKHKKVLVLQKKDTGIYDAMNQAVAEACGKYVYFLNCGDCLYSNKVLEEMAAFISEKECAEKPGIFYGNIFERGTGQQAVSNPKIDAFGCYRNVPCHQACFYDRRLLLAHPFHISYRVRADYEQFLWCFFVGIKGNLADNADSGTTEFYYKELLIADYEGGGFSETKENRRVSRKEHREITKKYIPKGQLLKFRLIMGITLAPLRRKLAENKKTAGVYNRLKRRLYLHR